MPNYMRLGAFRTTPLVTQPFQHLVVPGFIGPAALAEINADYPKISSSGSFPVDQVTFGPAFQSLLDELESDEFRDAFEEKFALNARHGVWDNKRIGAALKLLAGLYNGKIDLTSLRG